MSSSRAWNMPVILVGAGFSLVTPVVHANGKGKPDHEVGLELVAVDRDEVAIEPESGWPLTAILTGNEEELLGIGVPIINAGFFPDRDDQGFLVFADPDGCPSFVPVVFQEAHRDAEPPGFYPSCSQSTPIPWPTDETWVEFTPGLTCPDPGFGARPELLLFDSTTPDTPQLKGIGPAVGSETDGYGYGPSPRLPGLVLVADAGPSIVTDENFDLPPGNLRCRNLAGFANSVAYELKDAKGKTSIRAHFNVPAELFTPVVLVDRDVTADCSSDSVADDALVRIDGGPLTCIAGGLNEVDSLINPIEVMARLFVVNIEAPEILEDLDGDGVCDAEDAEMAGYELLSDEEILRFRQLHEEAFGYAFDFDGNGDVGDVVLPAGAGVLTSPPR